MNCDQMKPINIPFFIMGSAKEYEGLFCHLHGHACVLTYKANE